MTDKIQRAACELADGSRIEIVLTSPRGEAVDLETALARLREEVEAGRLPKAQLAETRHGIVGQSACMQALFRMIDKVSPTQATVLISGENGTGKELVARAIHDASTRAGRPFVAANVSAFNDNLLESELFGHRRGSFTGAVVDKRGLFEEADTGTFLLDEVGDMSPALQAKLLRVLQEGTFLPVGGTQTKKVDVRIIAATNRDLTQMVKKGSFREDLYYRLHVVALRTPALRERGSDLDLLVDHFLATLALRHGRDKRLSPEAREALHTHPWPGNVRELQNEIERVWVLSGDDPVIHPEQLSRNVVATYLQRQKARQEQALDAPFFARAPEGALRPSGQGEADLDEEPLHKVVERVERQTLERVLAKVSGNRTRAAQVLGISRRNLIRKLELLGLSTEEDASE